MRVCTIVAKNYLAHARVLADSYLKHNPGGSCTVLVIDGLDGLDPDAERFEILTPAEIGVEDFDLMAGLYDVLELSTAVKPWLLRALMRDDEHVAYLDPDIEVFAGLGELDELIGAHGLVLTPHNTEPVPDDGKRPTQTDILVAGAYNLGFIGLRRGEDADHLIDWWAERLLKDCRRVPDQGLFVDQRWMDLAPGMVSDCCILRDPGYNVAYWNLPSRRIERRGDGYLVNGRPLRFFHFSGYEPERPRRLSRHQDRIRLSEEPAVRELCDRYAVQLREHGYEEARAVPYGLDRTAAGQSLDPQARELYRTAVEQGGVRASLFTREGLAEFERWEGGPAEGWGVNVIGHLRAEMGNGETARQYIGALESREVPVRRILVPSPWHREEHEFEVDSEADLPINLVCMNADILQSFAADEKNRRLLRSHYTVGLWWWEVSSFPASMRKSFDLVDEVWAGSEFVAEIFGPIASVPIHTVPHPINPQQPEPAGRAALGLPEGFLFLFMFDYRGVARRKNATGLVEAFSSAFEPGEGPQLVVKCINPDAEPAAHAELRGLAEARPDVTVLEGYVSSDQKNAMIAACDCYVSLHRSEGFGQTLAEAMFFGRPVIATGYSGNLEFMTPENSYLVDYELGEIGPGAGPYPADAVWAEPDLDHAAELMRRVCENPAEAAERGHRAAADIRRTHSHEAAGRAMERRLRELRDSPRRSALGRVEGDDPVSVAASEARQRVMRGPPERSRTRLGGPVRELALRLMRPWTSHQRGMDLMLINAIDQLNVALRDLEPARAVAEGWRAVPGDDGLQLTSFEHPVAGKVLGYGEPEPAEGGAADPGSPAVHGPPEAAVKESRRPYLELLAGHAPVLDAGCGRGELLDLLRERGIECSGVEPDPQLAAAAREKGHEVAGEDLVAHLDRLDDGSLGAIFSAQGLRLPLADLTSFLELARSRLSPAGLLVANSANPHSSEALKLALTELGGAAPLMPEVALRLCAAARYEEAFVFYPQASGDAERDRHSASSYALVAMPGATASVHGEPAGGAGSR
ncbi:MAG: glycosyltransferase [Actinomycetota bacterium]